MSSPIDSGVERPGKKNLNEMFSHVGVTRNSCKIVYR